MGTINPGPILHWRREKDKGNGRTERREGKQGKEGKGGDWNNSEWTAPTLRGRDAHWEHLPGG
jgi:hypothetical protein